MDTTIHVADGKTESVMLEERKECLVGNKYCFTTDMIYLMHLNSLTLMIEKW